MSKRITRRILVVIYYLALLVVAPLLQGLWEGLMVVGLLFLSPATATGTEMLKAFSDEGKPDERQSLFINNTIIVAYVVLAGLLIGAASISTFADLLPVRIEEVANWYISKHLLRIWVMGLLLGTLPPAVMMWLEPDPIPDDAITIHQTAH